MMAASQIVRFYDEFKPDDAVLTYDPGQRLYFIGKITSGVQIMDHELFRTRAVSWSGQIPRDALKQSTRNSLGAISTLFAVRDEAAADVRANTVPLGTESSPAVEPVVNDTERDELVVNIEDQSNELLEDRIASLDWEQMQQLIAEIPEAWGSRQTSRRVARIVGLMCSPHPTGWG